MSKFLWASHFSGCGGSTVGAIAANFRPLVAIEFDPQIAELYKANCGDAVVNDIAQVDPTKLDIPSPEERRRNNQILVLQTSPPCQEYSQAKRKQNRQCDRATILKDTYAHYELFKPEYVILENVPAYANSPVYLDFENFLIWRGYKIVKGIYNMADYGVPQTRKRFIAIAVRDGYPIPQIQPTHSQYQQGQLSLFGDSLQKWVGWYDAIADLIPGLPESKLTQKQKDAIVKSGLVSQLVDFANATGGYTTRKFDKPIWTLNASIGEHNAAPKAVLIERVGYQFNNPKTAHFDEPCWTLRACLGDDGRSGRSKVIDAVVGADVRSLDARSLARLQSFPDSYQWSGNSKIDLKGIGNSVCPLFSQLICQQIKEFLS
jgi:DNA (cytosine-5)-methyltransferase 1